MCVCDLALKSPKELIGQLKDFVFLSSKIPVFLTESIINFFFQNEISNI